MPRIYDSTYREYNIRISHDVPLTTEYYSLWRSIIGFFQGCCCHGATVAISPERGYKSLWERKVHRCDIAEGESFEERLKGVLLLGKLWVDGQKDRAERERQFIEGVLEGADEDEI